MISNNGVPVPVHGASGLPVRERSGRGRAGPAAVGLVCILTAGTLVGCSMGDGVGSFMVNPSRYSAYHCNALVSRLSELIEEQNDLRNLMDKASEGGGGSVIGTLSYRSDYEKALGEEKLLRRTAAEKKCQLPPPVTPAPAASVLPPPSSTPTSYQSDQTIR
jgi:hypothetical protein